MMEKYSKGEKLDIIADSLLLFFPFLYRRLMRSDDVQSNFTPVNMELRSLFILIDGGTMQSSELGRKLGISKSNVTPLVDRLTEKGYTIRLPDQRDRRVINISVTDKGKQYVVAKRRVLVNRMKLNLSTLKVDELDSLYSSIETFRDIISRVGVAH